MVATKSERFVSVYPRVILREVGRLTMVDYDMCARLHEHARGRLASWVERYYDRHVSRVHRASIERWHGRLYVGTVSGQIVVKPEHVGMILSLVLLVISDLANFDQPAERTLRAVEVADTIVAKRGQPTHAERVSMAGWLVCPSGSQQLFNSC